MGANKVLRTDEARGLRCASVTCQRGAINSPTFELHPKPFKQPSSFHALSGARLEVSVPGLNDGCCMSCIFDAKMVLQAIRYTRGKLEILDQLRLPHEEVYIELRTPQDAWDAIYKMQTRGAPAIAMVAALSLAVSLPLYQDDRAAERGSWPDAVAPDFISHTLKYLVTSRPTAVNLADAARKLERVAYAADALPGATRFSVNEAYIQAAEKMLVHDVHDNENIGAHGADWIVRHSTIPSPRGKLSVLTHCNTGYVYVPSLNISVYL